MTKLLLLGTFWNEADWIEYSLKQIEQINPSVTVICDGNFDPTKQLKSNDGTSEIIQKWAKDRSSTYIVTPVRHTKEYYLANLDSFKVGVKPLPFLTCRHLRKLILKTHEYRLNQAATFAHMCRLGLFKSNCEIQWITSYDADQFYPKQLINIIQNLDKVEKDTKQICAREKTFFNSFNEYTTNYEKRQWNNLPFKKEPELLVYPTRHFAYRRKFYYNFTFKERKYYTKLHYMHYKFRNDHERDKMTYALGDRKPPTDERISGPFKSIERSEHSEVILDLIENGWGVDFAD